MADAAQRLASFLGPKRLGYAWIAGAALWIGWLISVSLGSGNVDLAGQVIGTDYLEFYAAGLTARLGESERLYDVAYQSQLQQAVIGHRLKVYYGFITPPFFAWVFAPLSLLPYAPSFAVWSLLGLLGLWLSLRLLGAAQPRRVLFWSLTWFPVFATISYGQNSLLSLMLLSLTWRLWRRGHSWPAGLVASLLLYKPQLLLGVGLLWLLEAIAPHQAPETRQVPGTSEVPGTWRANFRTVPRRPALTALLGLAAGGGMLFALSVLGMPEASRAYWEFARTVLPNLPAWQEFPLWNLHTVWGFWRLLLPAAARWADVLHWLFAIAGVVGFVVFRRKQRGRPALLYAAAIGLTLWATPHAMIYDWTLLLIPAVTLWQDAPAQRDRWKILFVAIWIASFGSGPLTHAQLRWLPVAVQISAPVLLIALGLAWRWVIRSNQPAAIHTA